MFENIIQLFIKDYKNIDDINVRSKYGTVSSILSIVLNGILVVFKVLFGFITNSISIMADGFNNLSDMGSNLATLFGFKLASKHPDSEHPYGHGRIEYIVGMIIAFLIFYVGFNALLESFNKLFNPSPVNFSLAAVIVLIFSILVKLYMSYFNNKAGDMINSEALKAAGADSRNDVISTFASLISLISVLFTDLPVDSIIGIFVSIFVIKSGLEIFKSTLDPLLGLAPSKELVKEIVDFTKSYSVVLGIHDLMFHDYGPSRQFLTMHVEVNSKGDIMDIHDQIDIIERDILKKFNILTTIHMDPIEVDNEEVNKLKAIVKKIVKDINAEYDIHDFRIVSGKTHTNLIFDVLLPANDLNDHNTIKLEIEKRVKEYNPNYYCVMEVEHAFI